MNNPESYKTCNVDITQENQDISSESSPAQHPLPAGVAAYIP